MTGEDATWTTILPPYWAKYLTAGQGKFAAVLLREPGEREPRPCQAPGCREPITCTAWERLDEPGKTVWGGHYFCSPHGEAWAAGHPVQVVAADPRYSVWSIPLQDRGDEADRGDRCQSRGCGDPATHITYTQDVSRKRPLESELFRCTRHAEEYARRHHVQIRPHIERGPR